MLCTVFVGNVATVMVFAIHGPHFIFHVSEYSTDPGIHVVWS